MSKAIYHPEPGREVEFDVIAQHKDGTVDLAFKGQPVVTSCKVTETPVIGSCVLLPEEKESVSLTKAELIAKAETLGIDTQGLNKADLVAAIELAEESKQ